MLETFVGKVDAELFEAVVLVVFETEYVKDSNGQDLKKTPAETNKWKIKTESVIRVITVLKD